MTRDKQTTLFPSTDPFRWLGLALSVRQPWANLIAQGKKTIETRTWSTDYRGELLIVSSRKPNIAPAGCAVALVELIDCRVMFESDEEAACCEIYPGAIAWCLENIHPVKPVAVRGRLGLYEVDVEVELVCG